MDDAARSPAHASAAPAPLRTALLRELLWAPELERYLGVATLDRAVTDQLQSVQVRVDAALRLIDARALAAFLAGWRRQAWLAAGSGVLAGAVVSAVVAAASYEPLVCSVVGFVGLVAFGFCAHRWRALRRDLRALRDLRVRHRGALEACVCVDDVLALASRIEDEVRTLAAPHGAPAADDDARTRIPGESAE